MQIYLPRPHSGQVAVREQSKRFNYLAAGRRWRKTTLVVAICVEASLKGKTILWTAPTYSQVEIAWNEFRKCFGNNARFHENKKTCSTPNNGKIVFRSLDEPDNARGFTADIVVIDEAGDVKEIAWYEVLRPMLMDTGGTAWIIGTPKRRNWFWREHLKAKMYDDSMAWQVPTVGARIDDTGKLVREPHALENPYIPFSELERMYKDMTERGFRQEILAEFMEETGGVFRNVRACATEKIRLPYRGNFAGALDWADMKDYTTITIIDLDTQKQVYMDRFNKIGYEVQKNRVLANNALWKPLFYYGELNSMGRPLIQNLQSLDVPIIGFDTNSASKPKLIKNHQLNLEKKDIGLINDEFLIAEHEAYEAIISKNGYVRYSAPEGMHDDLVMVSALNSHSINLGAIEGIGQDVIDLFENFTGK